MKLSPFARLLSVAICFRGADQLMVAGTPLVAAALFGLAPDIVGLLIAIQGSAWLLVSLPAGVAVDRAAPLDALKAGMAVAVAGAALAIGGLWLDHLPLFGLGAFASASAAVIGLLAEIAAVQRLVEPARLPFANGRIQTAQSAAMLAGPLAMGWAVQHGQALAGYGLALALALGGLALALRFGAQERPAPRSRRPLAELGEGLAFVRGQPLLRGIVACALFWNLAFFALMAVFVPYALGVIGLDAAEAGLAQGAMGVGSLAAAIGVARIMAVLSPRAVLVFGPASSALATALLPLAPAIGGPVLPALVFFLLGFGPILWFVCQNSIRQLVTPAGMLGRVGSVIQVAIYGVRSLGALAGGLVAARLGFGPALALIVALFLASTLAVFASALIRLRAMPASPAG